LTTGFSPTLRGTVLAFDLGLKRTGVASGELGIGIAHPLTVLHADSTQGRLDAIAGLIGEWQPALLVLGLPTHADGSEHEMTRAARNFARKLFVLVDAECQGIRDIHKEPFVLVLIQN